MRTWGSAMAMAAALGLITTPAPAQDEPVELPDRPGTPREADAPDVALEPADGERFLFWPPRIESELVVEIQNDYTFESDDRDAELNDLSTTTELDINTFLAEPLFINTHFTLEAVEDPEPGEDRFFGDYGVFIENLSLNWEEDGWSLIGGKFGPNFSIAFDAAPGIYGTDFAEDDIELAERIGFGGSVTVLADEDLGAHALSASAFFADTSPLSESFGTNRGRFRERDGGPSNTGSPESFTVALDGLGFAAAPGFRYHIAGARQAVDRVNGDDGEPLPSEEIEDEYRFAIAAEWAIDVNDEVSVTPLLEYVHFWNAEGIRDEQRDYLTASALLLYRNWNLATSYTGRFIDAADGSDRTDTLFQVSGGYTFDFGLEADVGYRLVEEDSITSHTVGVFFVYDYGFIF